MATDLKSDVGVGDYQYGFHDPTDQYVFKSRKGLDEAIVRQISEMKNEPAWMTEFRLKSLEIFFQKPMPPWGGNLGDLNFQDIFYFVQAFRGAGARLGRRARRHPQDLRPAGHSRGRKEVPRRRESPVRSEVVYGSLEGRPARTRA